MAQQLLEEVWASFVARLSHNLILVFAGLSGYAFATHQVLTWQIVTALALSSLSGIWLMQSQDSYHPTHRKEYGMLRELINQLIYLRDRALERFISSPELPTWEDDK